MVIAPTFVFIHLSKTGGTFAADMIRELLCPSYYGRKLHRLKTRSGFRVRLPLYRYKYDEASMHAVCNDIPPEHQNKTILSCIRNPFDLYVSEYTYGWWKQYPERWFEDLSTVEKQYPAWREWTFAEFLVLSNKHARWVSEVGRHFRHAAELGWYTQKFIYYYCRDFRRVFEGAEEPATLIRRVRESMHPVHFLHTERLNEELYQFLRGEGFLPDRIEFIRDRRKIKTSRKNHDYRKWYSDALRDEIETRDRLIFELFPEYTFAREGEPVSVKPPREKARETSDNSPAGN